MSQKIKVPFTESIADPKTYHSYLDGLRGLATLMVVAVHTSQAVGNIGRGCFAVEFFGKYNNEGSS